MTPKDPSTPDLFFTSGKRPLDAQWPDAHRFPLNHDAARVRDTLLPDLNQSTNPLLVTGFATLDQVIGFVAGATECEQIRIVFGSEPMLSQRPTFSLGHPELTREIRTYWMARGISVLLSARLIACLDRLRANTLQTRIVARQGWRLHAKIYVADHAAMLGSSNFTRPGLETQLEANVRFQRDDSARKPAAREEHRRYEETAQLAEQFWHLGRDFNSQLIELLEQLLRVVPWQQTIARASAELLEARWAKRYLRGEYLPGDADLWPSQRQGIAQALYILKERGSVLVADATGSGKTRAGVHLIGAKVHEIIASNRLRRGKAVLISPPAVTDEWRNESALASVPLEVYSHGALSVVKEDSNDALLNNLRRAQILCVDEGHNFLNMKSNRTQQLLRNMADHVALFTATPINRSASDLLRIADMLGADNLDDSTLKAFERMLGARSISRSLTEDEITELRQEIAKFTVRRTKRVLNDLIDRQPDAYTDARGQRCRFPRHQAVTYSLKEPADDRAAAAEIRRLALDLKGLLYFQKDIALPKALRLRGLTEDAYLKGRLNGATRLSQYCIMCALRSSRAALLEHLLGTAAAAELSQMTGFSKSATTGDVLGRLAKIAGKVPRSRLAIELPAWLRDADEHRAACEAELETYRKIERLARSISTHREQAKARLLHQISKRFTHVLAFDSRPISLAFIQMLLEQYKSAPRIMVATGDTKSDRRELLSVFSPRSKNAESTVGLCSDSVAEGVNLQRAQAIVHLDMPTVVRIAEQRSGRIDRLDSPHRKIYAWWPEDAPEFALRADERFIERYETVDHLLGSNMPLPESIQRKPRIQKAEDAIREFETIGDSWDGIDDAFSPVRSLVSGESALVPEAVYSGCVKDKTRVVSHVSLVSASSPWAFFCTTDTTLVPRWILLKDLNSEPQTDLRQICQTLRRRLGKDTASLPKVTQEAERLLEKFLARLSRAERRLLSRRKRRALDEMQIVLQRFLDSAGQREDQPAIDTLSELVRLLKEPPVGIQPDWEELAARWLDLIRPIWYEKLQQTRRTRPLLLKDIRSDLLAAEAKLLPQVLSKFAGDMPAQRPVDERIVACVVGVPGGG